MTSVALDSIARLDRALARQEYMRLCGPLQAFKVFMETLILIDRDYLRLHQAPRLLAAHVNYSERPPEEMRDVGSVLEKGEGSAVDLIAWRAAELLLEGRLQKVRIVVKRCDFGHSFFTFMPEIVAEGRIEHPWKWFDSTTRATCDKLSR